MQYLSKEIEKSPIIGCEVLFITRKEAEEHKAIPSSRNIVKACRRFKAIRIAGGETLALAIMHIESTRNEVLAHLRFRYDESYRERYNAPEYLPYLDEEIEELPCLDLGRKDQPPVVLEELIDLSKMLALPENRNNTDVKLISTMMEEVALLLAKSNCQGSA